MIAALALLTVSVAAVSYGCKMAVASRAGYLKSQLGEVQSRSIEQKRELAAMKRQANQRTWQKQLTAGSRHWLGVMNAVLNRVPSDAWLSRIESSNQNMIVDVDGRAFTMQSVSSFVKRLRRAPGFADVRLISTRSVAWKGLPLIDFAIQAKLRTAAGATPAPEPVQAAGVPDLEETP